MLKSDLFEMLILQVQLFDTITRLAGFILYYFILGSGFSALYHAFVQMYYLSILFMYRIKFHHLRYEPEPFSLYENMLDRSLKYFLG